MKAKTDSQNGISFDESHRKPLANLIKIFAHLKEQSIEQIVSEISHLSHREFKEELSKQLASHFKDFLYNYHNISEDYCRDILRQSMQNAHKLASRTMSDVMNKIVFI